MRELYEKYYTARLWFQPDEHVVPEIIDIDVNLILRKKQKQSPANV